MTALDFFKQLPNIGQALPSPLTEKMEESFARTSKAETMMKQEKDACENQVADCCDKYGPGDYDCY